MAGLKSRTTSILRSLGVFLALVASLALMPATASAQQSSTCDYDEYCLDGACRDWDEACGEDADCPDGFFCHAELGCEPTSEGCSIDDDCDSSDFCWLGKCVQSDQQCVDNADCGADENCDQGFCRDLQVSCESDEQCEADNIQNFCHEYLGCTDKDHSCDTDNDCDAGDFCWLGACLDDDGECELTECSSDDHCPGDDVCMNGECQAAFDPVNDPVLELQDDFSGTWKECLWRPYERIGGSTVYHEWDGTEGEKIRVENDKLELAMPAHTGGGLSWDFGLESRFLLGGNFQAEVDYEIATDAYYANLDMRGVNMLFIELMAGEEGTRRRHVRNTRFRYLDEEETERPPAHIWLSNQHQDTVTQIDTDEREWLREIPTGQRPNRTAVDLDGNVYIHNRGSGYTGEFEPGSETETTITFVKASACQDPDCDLSDPGAEDAHVYTLDISGGQFGQPYYAGRYGGGVAVDRDNNLWYGTRLDGILLHIEYIPSEDPGGDDWQLIETYDLTDILNQDIRTYGMAMARDGNIWIATRGSGPEGFVEVNPSSGEVVMHELPSELASDCVSTYGVAIDAEQRLFWATLGDQGSLCTGYRYDPSEPNEADAWIRLSSDPMSDHQESRGMAADSQGRVWNASDGNDHVVAFDAETGEEVMTIDTCNRPVGVALDRNNLLWVSCESGDLENQVQVFDMNGNFIESVYSEPTYTYSDMTGYQLRNFGIDDWEEIFTEQYSETSNEYFVSVVENNYGGGIEYGAGGESALDPAEAPFEITSGDPVLEATRMRVSMYYHIDGIYRIVEHPLYLEGVWGLKTHFDAELGDYDPAITMEEDGHVYIAFDDRAPEVPQWLSIDEGWSPLSAVVYTTDPDVNNILYRKHFEAGEVVEFGSAEGWDNYFVYVYPDALDTSDEPESPDAIIDAPDGDTVNIYGKLRIERDGDLWTYSYQDGSSGEWRTMERSGGTLADVPIRLRVRLDPFWHSGPLGEPGEELVARYDNFIVNYAGYVPGAPYCTEGCDETLAGYGESCLGGPSGLCPGVLDCNEDDVLECFPQQRVERCNGLDDDCDGFADHNASGKHFEEQWVSYDDQTYLIEDYGMPGLHPDSSGGFGDEDADYVHEGYDCQTDLSGPCSEGYWECSSGVMACQSFNQPQPEQCDGQDNSCDGEINQDLSDPIVQVGGYVQASQRSAPNTPIRPLGGEGASFLDYVNFDGHNVYPEDPHPIEEGKARVSIFVQENAGGDLEYVLWLSHGATTPDQGAVTASYHFNYFGDASAKNVILQDGVIGDKDTDHSATVNPKSQQLFVDTGATQTGGVGLGPFDPYGDWSVDIAADFSGHVTDWEIFNAATGEVVEITPNEVLTLASMSLNDLYGDLTADVGSTCQPATNSHGVEAGPGICSRGSLRCHQNGDGDWEMWCRASVVPQLEVCDGRDNSCNGIVDGDLEDLTFPVVEIQDGEGTSGEWVQAWTTDTEESAVDFMNFQQRFAGQPRVGSPHILDVTDLSGETSIQDIHRSVMTVHRDVRQYVGTLSLVVAHGKSISGEDADVPPKRNINMVFDYDGDIEEEESFPVWFADIDEQEDGPYYTDADRLTFNRGQQQYFGDWDLHRWVENDTAHREADGGVISNIFTELEDVNTELTVTMQNLGLDTWEFYSPYFEDDTNFLELGGTQTRLRVVPKKYSEAFCTIQDSEVDGCLGDVDIYTCQDGQVTCGIGSQGCCSPEHPFYGTECGEPEDNVGACRMELRCDPDGAWECTQVQGPEPEMCDGQDNTCDGIVDGMYTNFEWYDEDGELIDILECPDGAETCGPAECNFEQTCACRDDDVGCRCIAAIGEMLDGPSDRICEYEERLENDMCVPVCSSSADCAGDEECVYGECI